MVRTPTSPALEPEEKSRVPMLDGWRALSILLVLAGHLLPIGPANWQLNGAVGATGMAIFFSLSGFLITSFLLVKPTVLSFLVRRFARILPLAWAAMLVLAVTNDAGWRTTVYNYLFIANLPPSTLFHGGEHLWSLCVEMQFYVGVALIAAVFGPRGLCLLPLLSLSVTATRIVDGAGISIFTYERLDEILAGATLALIYYRWPRLTLPTWLTLSMFPLTLIASHEGTGYFMYLRPYLAATMVGTSIYAAPVRMRQIFELPMTIYIAKISYGLYVLHGMLSATWLGTGSPLPRYAKRPLLVLTTFVAAALSYRYYETPARRWAQKLLSSGPFKQV